MKGWIVLIVVLVAIGWFWFRNETVVLGPGVMAPTAPQQQPLMGADEISHNGYTLTPKANFQVQAKVLARESYLWGKEGDLSPVDLALGWGRMSDESILKSFKFGQSGRWYRWTSDNLPIPESEVIACSANMHMIPSNDQIAETLKRVKEGHIIDFHGYLVEVTDGGGWRWNSSLSREDSGAGACEIVYLLSLNIHDIPEKK